MEKIPFNETRRIYKEHSISYFTETMLVRIGGEGQRGGEELQENSSLFPVEDIPLDI